MLGRVVGLAIVVGTLGCTDSPVGPCKSDAECRPGHACNDGRCAKLCISSADCERLDQVCADGVCGIVANAECSELRDCANAPACMVPNTEQCVEGRCIWQERRCNNPPASECVDANSTFRTFGSVGVCAPESDRCVYSPFDVSCAGCDANCLGACAGVQCPSLNGGCQIDGRCVPMPSAHCEYNQAPTGLPCQLPNDPMGGLNGICTLGQCVQVSMVGCNQNTDCAPQTCISDLCRPQSGIGAVCDTGDDNDCQADMTCVANICLADDGLMCITNAECVNTCVVGSCATPSGFDGPCDDAADCTAGYACNGIACKTVDGGSCTSDDDCLGSCINMMCAPRSDHGEVCDDTADCNQNLTCVLDVCLWDNGQLCASDMECASNVCIGVDCSDPAPLGGNCDPGEDSDCEPGLICSGGTCLEPNGNMCNGNSDCANICENGTCKNRRSNGQSCDNGEDADCLSPMVCDGGTCRTPNNETCGGNSECVNTCISGTCANPAGSGGTCDNNDQSDCGSNLECVGTTCRLDNGQMCSSNASCVNTCIGGSCTDPRSAGNTCDSGDDADCQGSLICNGTTCRGNNGYNPCSSNNHCVNRCIGGTCSNPNGVTGACDAGDDGDCSGTLVCDGTTCRGPNGWSTCSSNSHCVNTCIGPNCSNPSGSGGACDSGDQADCGSNLTCVGTTCRLDNGQSCGSNSSCVNTCENGTCKNLRSAGQSCDSGDNGDCQNPLVCDGSICRGNNGWMGCTSNGHCVNRCIGGTCANASGMLGPCDTGDNSDCSGSTLDCDGGTCRGDNGYTGCNNDNECINRCIGGDCDPPHGPCQSCDIGQNGDCAGALICDSGTCRGNNGYSTCSNNCDCINVCIGTTCSNQSVERGACDESADCNSGRTCQGSLCLNNNGQTCTANNTCVSGAPQCECTNASCSNRVCNASNCVCRYGSGGSCTTNLNDSINDPEDCTVSGRSCWSGGCRADNPGTCACGGCDQASGCIVIPGSNGCNFGWQPLYNCSCMGDIYFCVEDNNTCTCVPN